MNPPRAEPRTTGEHARTIARHVARTLLALALTTLPACTSSMESENDRLRAENLGLRNQVDALSAQQRELAAKLSEANQARQAALDPQVLDALSRVASIEIDSRRCGTQPREHRF